MSDFDKHIISLLWDMMKPWEKEQYHNGDCRVVKNGNKYELKFKYQFAEH